MPASREGRIIGSFIVYNDAGGAVTVNRWTNPVLLGGEWFDDSPILRTADGGLLHDLGDGRYQDVRTDAIFYADAAAGAADAGP